MKNKLFGCLIIVVFFSLSPNTSAAGKFSTLHEVIRHFQVAFVERPNLGALLMGGLEGIKQAAPKCEIQVLSRPALFLIKAGGKSYKINRTAISNYKNLEKALVQAAKLVKKQKLAKNHKALEHAIIRGIVSYCGDPWSVFLEADFYKRLLDDGTQSTGDVGLLVEPHQGGLQVLDVVVDTPAHKAGIKVGMKVDQIAGRAASQLNELEALALMRGKIGRKIKLSIAGKKYELACAPEPKRNLSVDPPENGIARVQLFNFRADTGRRLASVMKKLQSMGLKGLVLDLRGNPGGLVTEATDVVGQFIKGGKVVSVVGKNHMRIEVEQSPRPGAYRDLPLVILSDHRTASVSEIVILALRDYGRAKLVGEKTLGKGTVQVVMELMDGSALKMSNGRYYSPKGTPLFEGIEPDIVVVWDGKGEDVQLKRARMLLK